MDAEDANGVVTSAYYVDWLDRLTSVIRARNVPNLTNLTRFLYDDARRMVQSLTDRNARDDGLERRETFYDALGQEVETRLYEDGSSYISTLKVYDAQGRMREISNPLRPSETEAWTRTRYDLLGRVTAIETPDGAVSVTAYSGNETRVTDPADKSRSSVTDALGRVITVIEDPDSLGLSTDYAYDAHDRVLSVSQGLQSRLFRYDLLGRLLSATNPESGTVDYPFYDGNGNLLRRRDARGVLSEYTYDGLNRPKSKTYSDGTPAVSYVYDLPGDPEATPNYPKGRLTSLTSGTSTTRYDQYDALGRVQRSRQTTAGREFHLAYTYDLAGNLLSETYPSGRVVTTTQDAAGRVDSVRTDGQNVADSFLYWPHGSVARARLGNGLWEQSLFNVRLQPGRLGLGRSPTTTELWRVDYGYGGVANNGNVLAQTLSAAGVTLSQSYGYDGLNRLGVATEAGSWSQTYTYDRFGNRAVTGYVPNPILTPTSLSDFDARTNWLRASVYDAAGNQARDAAGRSFTYDAENRQRTLNGTDVVYAYDAEGRRVEERKGGGTTIYVYDAMGSLVAEYADPPRAPATGMSYLTADTLGSLRVVTDEAGVVKARHDYLPFGEEIAAGLGGRDSIPGYQALDTIRHRFTGKERDPESQLDFFGARYLSAAQGRFTSPDPDNVGADVRDPQSWNGYSYVLNNPLKYVDPSGLVTECALDNRGGVACTDFVEVIASAPEVSVDWATDLPEPVFAGVCWLEALSQKVYPHEHREDDRFAAAVNRAYLDSQYQVPLIGCALSGPCLRTPRAPAGRRPTSFTPAGAGRTGAFNEAKRLNGIPTSQQPSRILPNFDARGSRQPGRIYEFDVPQQSGGVRTIRIRDDAAGHVYLDNPTQNRGPHFNDPSGRHFDYN